MFSLPLAARRSEEVFPLIKTPRGQTLRSPRPTATSVAYPKNVTHALDSRPAGCRWATYASGVGGLQDGVLELAERGVGRALRHVLRGQHGRALLLHRAALLHGLRQEVPEVSVECIS